TSTRRSRSAGATKSASTILLRRIDADLASIKGGTPPSSGRARRASPRPDSRPTRPLAARSRIGNGHVGGGQPPQLATMVHVGRCPTAQVHCGVAVPPPQQNWHE